MGARMRAFDWSRTPLGRADQWPQSLKTAVRIMLTSRQAMFVWWGDQLINLYNDAYKAIVGGKHPEALGQPASQVWREIWDQVGPRAESAILDNEGTYDESLLLIMERNGYPEETYYTFSYSPVPNDEGGTGGIICANTDDTQRIVGERQLALLRELAARTVDARTFDRACTLSAECLATNPKDLPFALIYLVDADKRRVFLAGTCGIERGHPAVPETASLDEESAWPFAEVIRTQKVCRIPALDVRFGELRDLPMGAWPRPPQEAVAVPIAPSGQTGRAGVLIAGLNPFRLYDDGYRGFFDLVAAQLAASIANAQAYEDERRRAEALAELDRAKTTFFSNVSHELRTPLTLMLGPVDDILDKSGDEALPNNRELLTIVHRNGRRLLKLVNTLLDFARIEAGRVQAVYEPVDLPAFTAELASVFRAAVDKAGLRLVIDCPPLPEPVFVDRDLWEKIVLNLISNAFKYTLAGEIRVSLRAGEGSAELAVQDTGTGIPAAELPNLFNRFHRVQETRGRTHEGTGIGLALVQELVKLHGGTVGVESVYGEGSTFTVTVPLGNAHLPADRLGGTRTLASTAFGAIPSSRKRCAGCPMTPARAPRPAKRSSSSPFSPASHRKRRPTPHAPWSSWRTTTPTCGTTCGGCCPPNIRSSPSLMATRRCGPRGSTGRTWFSPTS
ncbi:MAG: GAF domain-containing sensor histidine kinase [Thermoanaerobaculia bacterium]